MSNRNLLDGSLVDREGLVALLAELLQFSRMLLRCLLASHLLRRPLFRCILLRRDAFWGL